MKKLISVLLVLMSIATFAKANSCKIKTAGHTLDGTYAGDWLSEETKSLLEITKGYELNPKFNVNEVDYILRYDLGTVGWPRTYRFASFKLSKVNSLESHLFKLELRSRDQGRDWSLLREKLEIKARKKIEKLLPNCAL